jgi:hypothetical protein
LSDNFPIQNGLKHRDALSPLLFNLSKHLSDNFPIQNGLKHGDALSPLLFNFALEGGIEMKRDTLVSGLSL